MHRVPKKRTKTPTQSDEEEEQKLVGLERLLGTRYIWLPMEIPSPYTVLSAGICR